MRVYVCVCACVRARARVCVCDRTCLYSTKRKPVARASRQTAKPAAQGSSDGKATYPLNLNSHGRNAIDLGG